MYQVPFIHINGFQIAFHFGTHFNILDRLDLCYIVFGKRGIHDQWCGNGVAVGFLLRFFFFLFTGKREQEGTG